MGCKSSKTKGDNSDTGSTGSSSVPPNGHRNSELFLDTTLPHIDSFLSMFSNTPSHPPTPSSGSSSPVKSPRGPTISHPYNERETMALILANSYVDAMRQNFRMKGEVCRRMLDVKVTSLKLKRMNSKVIMRTEAHMGDDGYCRVMQTWIEFNPHLEEHVSYIVLREMLERLGVVTVAPHQDAAMVTSPTPSDHKDTHTFLGLLERYHAFFTSDTILHDLFYTYSDGSEVMSVAQYAKFLIGQGYDATSSFASDKIRSRFGGTLTKYNFSAYIGSLLANNTLDPLKSTNVWQDMTQPLTCYAIRTANITSEVDLRRSIHEGVRSFVVHVTEKVDEETGETVVYSGSIPLKDVMAGLRDECFASNPYPVILCLAPQETLSVSTQDKVAEIFTATFDNLTVARGIMFEGATITDPQFSPAALQNKVLLMTRQASLKPFVGFHVADMNRNGLGVRVTDVKSMTPAAKAGIIKDDWLTHINGVAIEDKKHLKEQLGALTLGEEFHMKKENLEEVKVVVGGVIDPSCTSSSVALSNLVFLKFSSTSNPGSNDDVTATPVRTLALSPESESTASNTTHPNVANSFTRNPWETESIDCRDLSATPQKRASLKNHFAFSNVVEGDDNDAVEGGDGGEQDADVREAAMIGRATNQGLQFMCPDGTNTIAHRWSRGFFAENCKCGYLLKNDEMSVGSISAKITILALPQHLNGIPCEVTDLHVQIVCGTGGGSAKVVHSIVEEGGTATSSSDRRSEDPATMPKNCSFSSLSCSSSHIELTDCDSTSVLIIRLKVAVNVARNGKSPSPTKNPGKKKNAFPKKALLLNNGSPYIEEFVAPLSVHMIRQGYRAVPALLAEDEWKDNPSYHRLLAKIELSKNKLTDTSSPA